VALSAVASRKSYVPVAVCEQDEDCGGGHLPPDAESDPLVAVGGAELDVDSAGGGGGNLGGGGDADAVGYAGGGGEG